MMSQSERTGRVEVEVIALKESLNEHKKETRIQFEDINSKLDDLLTLRNKGLGAFWLITSLIGTGVIGALLQLISYMRGQ